MIKEIFHIASTILPSLGGAGVIIIGIFGLFGKTLSKKILQDEKQKHDIALENLRSDLKKDIENQLEELKNKHQAKMDLLIRKREIYQQLIKSLRIFVANSEEFSKEQKDEFLQAYDVSYLWASDEVLTTLGKFLDAQIKVLANNTPQNQKKAKDLYIECIIQMRKDSGFSETSLQNDCYRFVHF